MQENNMDPFVEQHVAIVCTVHRRDQKYSKI